MASHIVLQVSESGTREQKRKDHEVKDLKEQYTLPDLKMHHPRHHMYQTMRKQQEMGKSCSTGKEKNLARKKFASLAKRSFEGKNGKLHRCLPFVQGSF